EGNCVVLDHGQGLLSLYLHLSEIKVKQGEQIERGQELGLSGGSGRATGPHLHLAVRWQGVYLNPATLLTLKLPSNGGTRPVSARSIKFESPAFEPHSRPSTLLTVPFFGIGRARIGARKFRFL